MTDEGIAVHVKWAANPSRGDRFEELWRPVAEAVLDYGGTGWAFFRAKDGLLDFLQLAFVPTKEHWESYWYSDEIGAARASVSGLHHVPLLPTYHKISGTGSLAPVVAGAAAVGE